MGWQDVENPMVNDAYWSDYEKGRYLQDEEEEEEEETFPLDDEEDEEGIEDRMPFYVWSKQQDGYIF